MKQVYCTILIALLIMCNSCKSDSEKMIGIWQNEQDWYQIMPNGKYNTGTGPVTFMRDLTYVMDTKKKEINFYTNIGSKTFMMNYDFISKDTMQLINKMEGSKAVKFYSTATIPTKF